MPTGIILKSASHEVSDEVREKNLQAVVESAGFEVAKNEEEEKASVVEPDRKSFKTDEEFEAAHVEWEDKQKATPLVASEDDDEEEEAIRAPKKSRRTRAIERATAELKKENEALKKQLEAKGTATPAKTEEPPKEAQRPKRINFQSDEAYEDALLAWGTEKALADKAIKEAQSANEQRFNENLLSYQAQVEEAKEAHDDWDEVVNQEIFIGREVQLAVLEQENGAEVIYYLGRHPAYAAKLGEMTPLSAVMEVGRLSARLKTGAPAHGEADGEDKPKPRPKVPAPVRTVSTAGSSAALTFAEIAAKPNYPGKAKDLRLAATEGR